MVNIFLPLPPLADQEEIVEHLNGISANTTALIGKVAEEISGLAEYRSAMIAEAVTGKIKL
jgi:type I restriction enzyme S subunit